MRLEKAEVGPTSGPTWCLSHLRLEIICHLRETALFHHTVAAHGNRRTLRAKVLTEERTVRLPPAALKPHVAAAWRAWCAVHIRRLGVDVKVILAPPVYFV